MWRTWIFLALLPFQVSGLTLTWDANPDTNTMGYIVYYGGQSLTYTNAIDVGMVRTAVIPGLATNIQYFFAVTAYNARGLESDFSAELVYTVTNAPAQVWLVQSWTATNIVGPWSNIITMRMTNMDQVRFFKTTATNETPRAPMALRTVVASQNRRTMFTTATLPPLPPAMIKPIQLPPRWVVPKRKQLGSFMGQW